MRRAARGGASALIEAALYSAGRPLSVDEAAAASGESRERAGELLAGIAERAGAAFRALEVAALPDGTYVFQLRPGYSGVLRRYAARPLMSGAAQKTLSLIVRRQPVTSRELVEARGGGVYAHLRELRQLELVSHRSAGRLKVYSTTDRFQRYFGIRGDHDTLREALLRRPGRAGGGRAA